MDNILSSYLQVSQHLSQHFRSRLGKLGLTFPQALTLSALGTDGPIPISKLAERTGSANSTISGVVDRLERLGYARRVRSDMDRRVILVETTKKYRDLLSKAEVGVGEYFDSLLCHLTDQEREKITQSLELLDRALLSEEAVG